MGYGATINLLNLPGYEIVQENYRILLMGFLAMRAQKSYGGSFIKMCQEELSVIIFNLYSYY